ASSTSSAFPPSARRPRSCSGDSRGRVGSIPAVPRAAVVLVLAALGPLVGCGSSSDESIAATAAPPEPTVLVTAFEPFGGAAVNASWEASKDLDGTLVAGRRVHVVRLPVVYDEMAKPLHDAIARLKPDAVVSFGVGRAIVNVERVAKNGYYP